MNKLITLITALLLTTTVWAQSPEKMSYQAVVRDASNFLVPNQVIGMQISILQGSSTGTVVYVETQTPKTNANGLGTIEIGGGSTSDDFSTIDWASNTYYIKTEIDLNGGTNYTITATSQLLSVPYALHAKTAENISGIISETDPVYTGSQAANITSTDITNLSNLSGINTGDQDLNELAKQSALEDTASNIRADIPDISGFISNETDPIFNGWNKDYADLINQPTTITTAQAAAILANTGKDSTGIYHANRTALELVSGTNTGDQDLEPYAQTANLATVATTGNYNDLADIPVQWDSSYISIKNTPDLSVYATKDMGNEKITNLADPTIEQDAATKAYVDSLFEIISYLSNLLDVDTSNIEDGDKLVWYQGKWVVNIPISNVALNKPADASVVGTGLQDPSRVFEGDLTKPWNSGDYPPQWVSVDLQDHYTITKIRMLPSMTPAGNTTHEIYISDDLVSWTQIKTLTLYQEHYVWEEFDFIPELKNVRGLRVRTTSSPSWVTWYEIEIYGY